MRDGPALVSALVDEVDRFALREEVDLDAAATNVVDALTRLVHLVQSPAFQALLDALDPTTLEFAARAAQATRETYTERQRIEQVGPWGMLRALYNADVRRALGFALAMLRRLGRALSA
ncbi:MAG: DUF1641 domain-containing protein [Ardenticatenia bacterium]|nr:DUF1641 domain-containing protein [Ardenticatenia bacterium]